MNQSAQAGNRGDKVRSDCFVELELRGSGGREIVLHSKVERMFGDQIRELARSVLDSFGIEHASLFMEDSGSLPFVQAARIEAAVRKLAGKVDPYLPDHLDGNRTESRPDRFRFSRLYLPGNTPSMMLNAGLHGPHGVILDLEDSVAPGKKEEARLLVRNALRAVDFYGAERMVRINQLPDGLADLDEVIPQGVNLILIPKCETAEQIEQADEHIRDILRTAGQDRTVHLMPIIESALGVENAFLLAKASPRVVALAIGLEDFTADLGVMRTVGGEESLYARRRLVNACAAAGIQAIDSVFSDVGDMEGLKETVIRSKAMGFQGMGCIHPRQVPVVHEGFAPGEEEIAKAVRIVAAFEEAQKNGLGVISLGSKMIDPPVVKRALQTVRLATMLGKPLPEPENETKS
ncbi:MAG: aldolase/citrate lyase family protein [Bacteroidales bacterium]